VSRRTIGFGVVGLGFGERVHLPAIKLLERENVRLVAVCARDRARASAAAQRFGALRAYSDWRDLVADKDVDVVSIATPPILHAPIASEAIACRTAVLSEKPLAISASDAKRLWAAAEGARVPTLVDFEFRTIPAFERTRAVLDAGIVGGVIAADVSWHLPTRLGQLAPSWKDDGQQGGGALFSLGVHVFDYLEWLVAPIQRLCGGSWTLLGAEASSDDSCAAVLEFESGAAGTLSVSTVAGAGRGHRLELSGERGALTLENADLTDYARGFTLEVTRVDGSRQLEPLPEPDVGDDGRPLDGRLMPFVRLARRLISELRGGPRCVPSFREGARAQVLCEALRECGRTGGWHDVASPPESSV
jgi:predicted dehydrogenase